MCKSSGGPQGELTSYASRSGQTRRIRAEHRAPRLFVALAEERRFEALTALTKSSFRLSRPAMLDIDSPESLVHETQEQWGTMGNSSTLAITRSSS